MAVREDTSSIEYVGGQKLFPALGTDSKTTTSVQLPNPGVIRISSRDSSTIFGAVNYFDAHESNSLEPRPYAFPARVASATGQPREQQSYVRILCQMALGLLVLEVLAMVLMSKGILRWRHKV